jgi:hypothetical protein
MLRIDDLFDQLKGAYVDGSRCPKQMVSFEYIGNKGIITRVLQGN